jgi:hypothetical protein
MSWLVWRQHRLEGLVALVVAIGVSGYLLADASFIQALAQQHGTIVAHCLAGCPQNERDVLSQAASLNSVNGLGELLRMAGLIILPALLGVFVGAPMIARELERGTHRLAWTQGITRRRWLGVGLSLVVFASLALVVILAAASTLWMLSGHGLLKSRWTEFDAGPVLIPYAVFALALGLAAGAVVRRTVPAMGITLAAFALVRFGVELFVRPHLLPTLTRVVSSRDLDGTGAFAFRMQNSAVHQGGVDYWPVGQDYIGAHGAVLSSGAIEDLMGRYARTHHTLGTGFHFYSDNGITMHEIYQPANHFWPTQGLEGLIFLALAAVLLGFTVWWVGRRAAV